MALLLLRTTVGLTLVVRSASCLAQAPDEGSVYLLSGSGIVGGSLLAIGFLTPLAGIVGGVGAVLTSLEVWPGCSSGGFDSRLALIFGIVILLALVLLGPGAYSVDARLFGLREIIIPRPDRRDE